MDTLGIYGI